MRNRKTLFIAFAIEDESQRNLFKGQSFCPRAPYDFIDMSVKEPYKVDWKNRVRERIRRSDGVIALVSSNSLKSEGQKWEIQCAKEESKPLLGVYAYSYDHVQVQGVDVVGWSDDNISSFIDSI